MNYIFYNALLYILKYINLNNMFKIQVIFLISFLTYVKSWFTTIPQGFYGVHLYLGQVHKDLIKDFTFYFALTSNIKLVKYIEDADEIENVQCVSKEGVGITIKSIQIANQIDPNYIIDTVKAHGFDYDKKKVVKPLEQKMREICAEMTVDELEIHRFKELDDILKADIQYQLNEQNLKITINWVRITGIIVPQEIKAKRLALASEKAEKILVEEKNKRATAEKLHEESIARKDAEIRLFKTKSHNEEMLVNANSERERKIVEFDILVKEGEARAKKIKLEAEALKSMDNLSNYYALEKMKALSEGSKMIYWGNELPDVMISPTAITSNT